ncbi:hypothetical protein OPT61_g2293 [Boeremia exigua]|uniref:Uncharacterized protein n=1 Tax=Boeremia exigua TaxID=749465 RepID=A0ACC2IM92_9PLEO|nr:hypothetical protein OPT61_g2293 [Boeremia exigua]
MSRQPNQHGARPVGSNRNGNRTRDGNSYSYSASASGGPVMSTSYQASPHTSQYSYSTDQQNHQPTQEVERAWQHSNPEVHRAVNDPNLNYTYQASSAPSEGHVYGQTPYQTTNSYSQHQYASTNGQGPHQGSTGGLTESQLYTHNYGGASVNNVEVWKDESQRNGPWYGNVEREQR